MCQREALHAIPWRVGNPRARNLIRSCVVSAAPDDALCQLRLSASVLAPLTHAVPVMPAIQITREMIMKALEKQGTRRRPHATHDDPYAEDKWLARCGARHAALCGHKVAWPS